MWFKYTRENLVVKKVVVVNHLMIIQCFYSSHTANRELLVCFTNHKLNEIIKNILISCIFLKTTVHFSIKVYQQNKQFIEKKKQFVYTYYFFYITMTSSLIHLNQSNFSIEDNGCHRIKTYEISELL